MPVSILKQRNYLIASVQSALTDSGGRGRCVTRCSPKSRTTARAGVIVDVAALDVIDSFVSRSLSDRRADEPAPRRAGPSWSASSPDVAVAMSQFGLGLDAVETALDLEAGLELLDR
jgi:rsbT antagonist protein RsbS